MPDSHSTPSSEASQIADIIEQGGFATIFEAQKAQAWKVIVQALRAFAVSDSAQRDAVLAFLRAELNVDEDGDPVGAQPEAGWETGYCSGIRHVYRALKGNAAPQEVPAVESARTSERTTRKTVADPLASVNSAHQPAESAPPAIQVRTPGAPGGYVAVESLTAKDLNEPMARCVAVPQEVFDWLMGEGQDFHPTDKQKQGLMGPGRYWWRSELCRRIEAAGGTILSGERDGE